MIAVAGAGSVAWQTDLAVSALEGEVVHRDGYVVVKTPSRPNYFWGNYLLFPQAPEPGDETRWVELYRREHPRTPQRFMSFGWLGDQLGALEGFQQRGFVLDRSTVLSGGPGSVREAPRANPEVEVRPISSDADWRATIDVHFDVDWPWGPGQRAFLRASCVAQRRLVDAGLASRFGAFLDGTLVGDLGVIWATDGGKLGRFDNVGTHPAYRRRGICRRLFHDAAVAAFERGLEELVLVAEEGSDAERIYRAVGFAPVGKQLGLLWTDDAGGSASEADR